MIPKAIHAFFVRVQGRRLGQNTWRTMDRRQSGSASHHRSRSPNLGRISWKIEARAGTAIVDTVGTVVVVSVVKGAGEGRMVRRQTCLWATTGTADWWPWSA